MQAITTTYRGPTNTRGSRIYAKCAAGRCSVPYEHSLNIDQNHVEAAKYLAAKLEWKADWCYGTMENGDYCHVQARDREKYTTI